MDFDVKRGAAGSSGAILSDSSVRRVYGHFGDKCLETYQMDIREKRTFMSAQTLRQVQSFVRDYGEDDAIGIIDVMFGFGHEGMHRGRPIGTSIFSKSFRWMADEFLIEHEQSCGSAF